MLNLYTDDQPNYDGTYDSRYPTGNKPLPDTIGAYYKPASLQFISWDFPNVVHTGIDIDYKMTGYDWYNRTLGWTVDSGPAGMTIDSDGRLHWTPSVDSTTEAVTLGLTFDGGEKITKSFTVTVENSRCLFIAADGSDTTGDGSWNFPYASREKLIVDHRYETDGKTIFYRGGTYNLTEQNWDQSGNDLYGYYLKNWNDNDQLLWRNYPGESVTLAIGVGMAFRQYGTNVTFQGINATGGDATETGLFQVFTKQAAKNCTASGHRCPFNNNPHGFHVIYGATLDQCSAWDNKDAANPTHLNNSNIICYAEFAPEGSEIHLIECIGGGESGYNFKTKRVGDECKVMWHNSIGFGQSGGVESYNNHQSIRHSWMIVESGGVDRECIYLGGGSDYTGDTDGGGLVQHCLLANQTSGNALWQNFYVYDSLPDTPAWWQDNDIVLESSGDGDLFRLANAASREVTWTMKWIDNNVYTPSSTNCIDIETPQSFDILNSTYGSGNALLGARGNYSKTVAGRSFTYNNGVFAEV